MKVIHLLWLGLAVVANCKYTNQDCCPDICDLEDVQCVTRGSHKVFKAVVDGCDGVNSPMDPLCLPNGGEVDCEEGTITNVEIKGLSECKVTKVLLRVMNDTYKHVAHCSKLTVTFDYELEGDSSDCEEKFSAKVTLTACDIDILSRGEYGIKVSSTDHKTHFFIKAQFNTHVYFDGDVTCDIETCSSCHSDKDEINSYKETFKGLFSEFVKKGSKFYVDGIDKHCSKYSMAENIPNEEQSCPKK